MYWHWTIATAGRERLWTTEGELAGLIRTLARIAEARLLLFCVVDDHVHAVVAADRAEAGVLARGLARALGVGARAPIGASSLRPVDDRAHLLTLIGYLLRQSVRHDLGVHPAAWPGSCFWDLAGARVVPGFDPAAIARALPRLDGGHLWRQVELDPVIGPPDGDAMRALGPAALARLAASALATDLGDRSADTTDARAIALQLARDADIRPRVIAASLGIEERSVRRLQHREVAPDRRRVVALRVGIACALRTARQVAPNASEQRSMARSRALHGAW